MAITLADVKQELERRRFPKMLTLDDYEGITAAVCRELTRYAPITKFVSFQAEAQVTDYYVFDPDDSVTAGVCVGAIDVKNVIWPPQAVRPRRAQQFSSQGWELVGLCGALGAYIRISPVPQQDDTQVVVEFTTKVTLPDVNDANLDWFYQWAEYYTADTLANLYATTAGVNLLSFADSKDAMVYWERKAKRYYDRAVAIQEGVGAAVMWG